MHQLATAQTDSRPSPQVHRACPAAVASQAAASVVDEVLQAGIETSSDARSVSEAQYSDDFESLGRKTPSRTGEVCCDFHQVSRHRQRIVLVRVCWSGPSHLQELSCDMSAGRSVALDLSMDGSTGSQQSARSAQLEAARAQAAQRLSQRQRVLSRKRREAALSAKAAMIERMQRDIAAADAEIQVG